MRLRWKDLLVMLNTACLAGIIVYLNYPDSNAAIIGGLTIFIACITIHLLQKALWRRRSGNY
jgi:hypothetical protein